MVDNPNYRIASSDAVLMSSRGGTQYDRSFMEAFIPPGPEDRDEAIPMAGDRIKGAVKWRGERRLESLVGKPVRLRFVMKDADLFSFYFGESDSDR